MTPPIRMRGFSIACGPPISDADWWKIQLGLCEGLVVANRYWMAGRDLASLDPVVCGLRYVPSAPVYSLAGELHQVCRLAPAVLHAREGSCLDLSTWVVARERELARVRQDTPYAAQVARVDIRIDPVTHSAHAVALVRGRVWDPASLS